MDDLVLVDAADRICTVTLNRPEARNALDSALLRASAAALLAAERDHSVDVVIFTGTDPAFAPVSTCASSAARPTTCAAAAMNLTRARSPCCGR